MKTLARYFFPVLLWALACGGKGGTETGNTDTAAIAAAMGSIFAGDEENARNITRYRLAQLLKKIVREARAQEENGSLTACELTARDEEDAEGVVTSLDIEAGEYGVPGNSVLVTDEDGCDQGGEYAAFTVTSHSFICTDSSTGDEARLTMDSGVGVWRENLSELRTEIYGTFNMSTDTASFTEIRCSLAISHGDQVGDSGIFSGDCVDSQNQAIEQAADAECRDE